MSAVSGAVSDCFVSVVAPMHDAARTIEPFVDEVMDVLRRGYAHYELILVDDGSFDDTVPTVTELLQRHECVRLVRLSREFGEEIAISAGLDSVIGDFVVVMIPNDDPPALIPMMVERAREGSGVVFGVRRDRSGEGFLARLGFSFFYWYCARVLRLNLPRNGTQFRVLSRRAVNAVTQIRDHHRYLRLLSADIGYVHSSVEYDQIDRGGRPGRASLSRRVGVAATIITANSRHPLRFVTFLGIMGSLLNVVYSIYVIAIFLFRGHVAEGWITLSLQSAGMFFLIFLILTVMSEYIGHLLVQGRDRPLYYVLDEHNSPVSIADRERRNIVKESRHIG